MKRLILSILGAGLLVGTVFYLKQPAQPLGSPEKSGSAGPVDQVWPAANATSARAGGIPVEQEQTGTSSQNVVKVKAQVEPRTVSPSSGMDSVLVGQIVDSLVSPQNTYEQKQAAWRRLREAGKLDQAISDLEQRMAANPNAPEYPSALGQAYLKKCGTLDDTREKGILALQADKLFETALSMDPSDWDARFTKAIAMTYWPPSMNKGDEVVQQFETLIQQQEGQPAQPNFAETYLRFGDFYQKNGQPASARTVWEQGAILFPNNQSLREKLAGTVGER
jgi:hypothetical protein